MKLNRLLEEINTVCNACNECEPCCTWNMLKKCIENERVMLHDDRVHNPALLSLVET